MSNHVVYFIRSTGGNAVKIGTTADLATRLVDLQRMNGHEIFVIRQAPGAHRVERWLHEHFAENRLRHEWFAFHPDMLTIEIPSEEELLREAAETPVPENSYLSIVHSFIRKRYLPLKNAAHLLAKDAGATPKTAENWLRGIHAPNGDKLVNLMASNPELHDRIVTETARRRAENRFLGIPTLEDARGES